MVSQEKRSKKRKMEDARNRSRSPSVEFISERKTGLPMFGTTDSSLRIATAAGSSKTRKISAPKAKSTETIAEAPPTQPRELATWPSSTDRRSNRYNAQPTITERPGLVEGPGLVENPSRVTRSNFAEHLRSVEPPICAEPPIHAERPSLTETPIRAERPGRVTRSNFAEPPIRTEHPSPAETPIRAERPGRVTRSNFAEHLHSAEPPIRTGHPSPAETPIRAERPGRVTRSNFAEHLRSVEPPIRTERPSLAETSTRAERPGRVTRSNFAEHLHSAEPPIRAEPPIHAERPGRVTRSNFAESVETPSRAERPGRAERPSHVESPGRVHSSSFIEHVSRAEPSDSVERSEHQRSQVLSRGGQQRGDEGEREGQSGTSAMAGSMRNVRTARTNEEPACDCPDGRHRSMSEHVLYVMDGVLNSQDGLIRETSRLSTELDKVIDNVHGGAKKNTSGQDFGEGNRRPKNEDICPICCCPFEEHENVVWCKAQCGTNVHEACFAKWKQVKGPGNATCIMCRKPWQEEGAEAVNEAPMEGVGRRSANELGSGRVEHSPYSPWFLGVSEEL